MQFATLDTGSIISESLFLAHIPVFLRSGLRMRSLAGAISDIHSVCTNPEVNLVEQGASHDPWGNVNTCFLFNFGKKSGICIAKRTFLKMYYL